MTEEEARLKVVACAREWIKLPYIDCARLPGIGGDCTFVSQVYEDAGVTPHIEVPDYTPQQYMNRTAKTYINMVRQFAKEIELGEVGPGDLVMYWYGRDYSHGAIITEAGWPYIIHADKAIGFIVEADGSQGSLASAKKRKFFTMWPKG